MNARHRVLVCALLYLFIGDVIAKEKGAFVLVHFGDDISIEVPANWKYQDAELSKHIDTAGEAMVRLAGIAHNAAANDILIAGNAHTVYKTNSASFRLSVRPSGQITQVEMSRMSSSDAEEIREMLQPIVADTERVLRSAAGGAEVRNTRAELAYNKHLYCIFTEFEVQGPDGEKLQQSYACPAGKRTVKLSTSYRKSEAFVFKPVVEYIWSSLRATDKN